MFKVFMNHIFQDMTEIFIAIYLDNILIFSNSLEDHQIHIRHVLNHLGKYDLHSKPEKCLFHAQNIEFLGFMVTPNGISMYNAKTDAISIWLTPTNLKAVQAFLGFTNFLLPVHCGIFQHNHPLNLPHPQGHSLHLGSQPHCGIKDPRLHTGTTLAHFNPDNPIVVETDASDYAIAVISSQISPDDGNIHPITFYSHSMQPTELNYKIYNKELLAIFEAFRQWCNYLEGSTHFVLMLSDHKNLEHFVTTKLLICCQVCWLEYLSGFNYLIFYCGGWLGTKPDALTH